MWLSDYFLKKYVEKQYEELSQMPDIPKAQEPSSYRGRNVADEKELEALNREAQAKNLYNLKPENKKKINQNKMDDLEAAMEEVRQHINERNSLNPYDKKIQELENIIRHLQKVNSAKDNHIKVLNRELEKSRELSPSTKNYITYLQEQAAVNTKDVSAKSSKSMSLK